MFSRIIFIWILIFSGWLSANESTARSEWVIVTGPDFPPYTDPDYPSGGLLVKLIDMVMVKVEGEYSLKWLPWRRGYLETIEGKYIATFPYVHTPERAEHLLYSELIIGVEERLFIRADDHRDYHQFEQFEKVTGCKPIGYNVNAVQDFLDSASLEILWADKLETCFLLLSQGRVDLVDMDKYVGYASIKKAGLPTGDFKIHERILLTQTMHLLVSKEHPKGNAFLKRFNASLHEVRQSNAYQSLLKEYLE